MKTLTRNSKQSPNSLLIYFVIISVVLSMTSCDFIKGQISKILGSADEEISTKLEIYQLSLKEKVFSTIEEIKKEHPNSYDL